jgi:hypothetical protein
LREERTVLLVWGWSSLLEVGFGFWLEKLVGVWWAETGGHLLLGVLGSRARNPYGIMELGSRIGYVPSWMGG